MPGLLGDAVGTFDGARYPRADVFDETFGQCANEDEDGSEDSKVATTCLRCGTRFYMDWAWARQFP
jgi:predicted sulfurtransferase